MQRQILWRRGLIPDELCKSVFKLKPSPWALDKLPTWPRCHKAETPRPPSGEALDGCPIYVHTHTHICVCTSQLGRLRSTCKNDSRATLAFLLPPRCLQCGQGKPPSSPALHKMEAAWVDSKIQSRERDKIHRGWGWEGGEAEGSA